MGQTDQVVFEFGLVERQVVGFGEPVERQRRRQVQVGAAEEAGVGGGSRPRQRRDAAQRHRLGAHGRRPAAAAAAAAAASRHSLAGRTARLLHRKNCNDDSEMYIFFCCGQ